MKKLFLFSLLAYSQFGLFAQQKEKAEALVEEGIAYHDKGDYEGALKKYNQALDLDKDNLLALAEKGITLLTTEKFEDAITYSQKAISTHSGEKGLAEVYVTLGNAFDGLKKTDNSIDSYDEGIKAFPDNYQLHFNKGITLTSIKKYNDAILCFQQSLKLNPRHPGSHNALARILHDKEKRIPAILAYCRFLILEPQTTRSVSNIENLLKLMNGDVTKTGKNSITINFKSDLLGDTLSNGKPSENSFTSTDLILTMSSALDYEKKNKKKSEVELFSEKINTMCSSLSETKKDNFGFYWDYYVPYFIEMQNKKMIETFSYIAFASKESSDVKKWLKAHPKEIEDFFAWSTDFEWKK